MNYRSSRLSCTIFKCSRESALQLVEIWDKTRGCQVMVFKKLHSPKIQRGTDIISLSSWSWSQRDGDARGGCKITAAHFKLCSTVDCLDDIWLASCKTVVFVCASHRSGQSLPSRKVKVKQTGCSYVVPLAQGSLLHLSIFFSQLEPM